MKDVHRLSLLAAIAMAAFIVSGATRAQDSAPSLESVVEELAREWFEGQMRGLPPEELPEQDFVESDIVEMRDSVVGRISDVLETSDALAGGVPDDAANAAAMTRLVEAYEGLEDMTPIFTKLALSKADDPAYRSGWRLCAIRVIAETWLPQAQEMSAQRDLAAQPRCEADLKAVQSGMLALDPASTEFKQGGTAVIEFTVEPSGAVSNLAFLTWSVTPSEEFVQDYVTQSLQTWTFPPREQSCRRQTTITFGKVEAE